MDNKESFGVSRKIRDGKIDDFLFQAGTLMFLLKEPNVDDKLPQKDDFFWFSEVVKAKTESKSNYYEKEIASASAKRAQSKYYNFLNAICEKLNFCIRQCSYVNLNPIGGGKKQSKEYDKLVEEFFPEKKKQIANLAPKAIICYGTYEKFKENLCTEEIIKHLDNGNGAIVKIEGKVFMMIKTKHPANRHVSNDNAIKQIVDTYQQLMRL